jgi:iron complex outermembrane recepter protein
MNFKRKFGLLGATILSVGFGAAAPALAQDDQNPTPAAAEDTSDEEIVVTGSRIPQNEFTSPAPIQVINAETATLEGLADTADILQSSTIASGSFQINNQFGGFVVEGGTGAESVSLRGLGAQRSLVLLNGRRPGPAGVRGQVGAFDLNVIPSSIVQRFEILNTGASSIYGSDAVAGVVNVITLDRLDRPVLNVEYQQPFEQGGETIDINGAFGLNFDRGNIIIGAQYQERQDLSLGDRDYLSCAQDIIYDPVTGARIDQEDQSILAGTSLAGCPGNIYFNTVIDQVFGDRYVPDPAGGPGNGIIPGYRPRVTDPTFYEDVTNDARFLSTDAINYTERFSLYAASNFDLDILGGVKWTNEVLYNNRQTTSEGWRQFFPQIGGASAGFFIDPYYAYDNDPGFDLAGPGLENLVFLPVTLWPSNDQVEIDYLALSSQLEGDITANWSWTVSGTYSRSDGEYRGNSINGALSGDVNYTEDAPDFNPLDPNFLSGNYGSLYDILTVNTVGNTEYEQTVFNGYVSGDLFELPAGPLAVAFGAEYRNYSINDTPDALSQSGLAWEESSAQVTAGEDTVREVFAEVNVPVLRGAPLAEELTLTGSARAFDYDTSGSDSVWSAGFNWQVMPLLRFRGTTGTSYRAPALYELFLGDQSAFAGQFSIDPCIDWGLSTNPNVQLNCAAEGIPDNYQGLSASATVLTGGGLGVLKPETSEARTFGMIFTPTSLNLSVAIDYFEMQVNDQVAQLGAGSILGGCYGANNYPNVFCTLFDRNPASHPTDPFAITEVRDSYINVNEQSTRGIDLSVRYEHEFDFGNLTFEGQATWTLEDVLQLFDPSLESGFDTSEFNGTIGDPDLVANTRVSLERGDWTYSWFMDFINATSHRPFADENVDYLGTPGRRIVTTDPVVYHDASIRWEGETVTVIFGVQNVFDEPPPIVSTDVTTRRGNVPLGGTQYDLRGRTGFLRFSKTF